MRKSADLSRATASSKSSNPVFAALTIKARTPVIRSPRARAIFRPRFSSRMRRQSCRCCQASVIEEASPSPSADVSGKRGKGSATTISQLGRVASQSPSSGGAPSARHSHSTASVIVTDLTSSGRVSSRRVSASAERAEVSLMISISRMNQSPARVSMSKRKSSTSVPGQTPC